MTLAPKCDSSIASRYVMCEICRTFRTNRGSAVIIPLTSVQISSTSASTSGRENRRRVVRTATAKRGRVAFRVGRNKARENVKLALPLILKMFGDPLVGFVEIDGGQTVIGIGSDKQAAVDPFVFKSSRPRALPKRSSTRRSRQSSGFGPASCRKVREPAERLRRDFPAPLSSIRRIRKCRRADTSANKFPRSRFVKLLDRFESFAKNRRRPLPRPAGVDQGVGRALHRRQRQRYTAQAAFAPNDPDDLFDIFGVGHGRAAEF